MSATIESSIGFDSVANDLTAAVRALWGHGLNGALKTIKDMRLARCSNLECFVVFIATRFTASHGYRSFRYGLNTSQSTIKTNARPLALMGQISKRLTKKSGYRTPDGVLFAKLQ
jgi:hypothetical protein